MTQEECRTFTVAGSLTPDGTENNPIDAEGISLCVPEPNGLTVAGLACLGLLRLVRRSP